LIKKSGLAELKLQNLKIEPSQWKLLRQHMKTNNKEIEQWIEKGQVPVFGYPPFLFSPNGNFNQPQSQLIKEKQVEI
jgi:hypothetical protein